MSNETTYRVRTSFPMRRGFVAVEDTAAPAPARYRVRVEIEVDTHADAERLAEKIVLAALGLRGLG